MLADPPIPPEREAVPGSRWTADGVVYVILPASAASAAPYTIPAVVEQGERPGARVDLHVTNFDRLARLD